MTHSTPREVTVYVLVGGPRSLESHAYPSQRAAEEALASDPLGWNRGAHVEPRQFVVAPDQFWIGDTIEVELHRGAEQDEDGIITGGAWQPAIGYADPFSVDLETGRVNGCLLELGTDRHIQTMELRASVQGYPYRNARLIRRREACEDGSV